MPHINLGDIRNLEKLTWAIYNGMYVPGSQLALSCPLNWACILDKVTTHIFHGRTLWEHCPLSAVGGTNVAAAVCLKGGPAVKLSRRKNQQKRPQAPWAPASPASKTPTLRSIINMPSGATLAHADGGVMTASLDLGEEDDEEPFHEFNRHRMQQCGAGELSEPPQRVQQHPQKEAQPHSQRGLGPEWQTIRWLQQCESEIMDDEVI